MKFNNADRFIINKPISETGGDPEYLIQQEGVYKVSFGWDDDGGGFGYIYNWSGKGIKFGAAGNNPVIEILTDAGNVGVDLHGQVNAPDIAEYADNAAALAAGLTAGDFYRTGDLLKVVH